MPSTELLPSFILFEQEGCASFEYYYESRWVPEIFEEGRISAGRKRQLSGIFFTPPIFWFGNLKFGVLQSLENRSYLYTSKK